MTTLQDIPVSIMREAAAAWRRNDEQASKLRLGPLSFLAVGPNMSTHDKIDDLIDEVERLREE